MTDASNAVRYAETGMTWLALVEARAGERDDDGHALLAGLDPAQLAHLATVGADIAVCWLSNYVEALGHDADAAGPAVVDGMRQVLAHVVASGGTCGCERCDGLRQIQGARNGGMPTGPVLTYRRTEKGQP